MKKLKIEVQYFTGCPNSQKMIDRVKNAVEQITFDINYKETLVETPEEANRLRFRGSPTLLIDGKDFENLPEPEKGNLSCRYYPKGLPETDQILNEIKMKVNNGN